MKKFLAILLVLTCSLALFASCVDTGKDKDKLAYVSVDINPSIELVVDKDNTVVSVRGENEDAQVLLYNESGINGADITDAIDKITSLAIELGYLDEDNKVVNTMVSSSDDKFAQLIEGKVNATVTATASSLGMTVTIDNECVYSLMRKLEEFKAKYPNDENIKNLTSEKFKLALSLSETGEVTLEAAVKLDTKELVEKINIANQKIEEFATDAYLKAKNTALMAYDKATDIAVYGVYTKFYIERIISNPMNAMTAYYGGVYNMYAMSAKGFDFICDTAELVNDARSYPLDEKEISKIVTALGMSENEIEELKDSNGEITIDSIEAYADKKFKNSDAYATVEEMKTKLNETLSEIESEISVKVNELKDEYKEEIAIAVEEVNKVLLTIEEAMSMLPESVKNIIDSSVSDIKAIIAEINVVLEDGSIEISELRAFADRLEEKANEYLNKIEDDLTDEEKATLEERKADAVNKMTVEKKKLESALEKAENEAKEKLSAIKEDLRKKTDGTITA